MRTYAIFIGLFLFLSLSIVSQAQEVTTTISDTIRIELPELPVNLDLQQFEIDRRAEISPFLYTPLNLMPPFEHHWHTYPRLQRKVPMPTRMGITGFGLNSMTHINRTALFSMDASRTVMPYFASTLGVVRTLPYGNINFYSFDVGAAFLLNRSISGSAGVFYRNVIQFPMPITGGYANFLFDLTYGTQLFTGATFQNVRINHLGVNQQTVFLEGRLRQRITDRWYVNAYGGTPVFQNTGRLGIPMNPLMTTYYGGSIEHWFNDRFAVEGGIEWVRSPFSGRMHARPNIGFHAGPRRR